jgi:diaminohydroxyphosphoribosylaminopyrimidine deaminase/5-amino-6-(5-phosphoribosylamino)uracil reductase
LVEESLEALRLALRLAARGRYRTSPNPRVGAVLVQGDEIVGRGWHRQVGGPHAEVEALRDAGERACGATLYVTLEPCSHHGRTPPCADAVIAAGIAKVVACHRDPDPRVSGRGFERLRAAGIEVEVGLLAQEAVRLNWRFLTAATLGRPAVTLKWAMSLDGRIATATGQSQWISSPAGRRWALALREENDAVLAGIGTVLADDPRLDRRLGLAAGPGTRVILDRRLRISPAARLFTVPGATLIYAEREDLAARRALEEKGAIVIVLPSVEPPAVLADLHARGIRSVLVEGGSAVHGSFLTSGCFDQVAVDCAPLLIGGQGAPGPLGGAGFQALADAARLDELTARRVGRSKSKSGDLILTGYRNGCLPDLFKSVGA